MGSKLFLNTLARSCGVSKWVYFWRFPNVLAVAAKILSNWSKIDMVTKSTVRSKNTKKNGIHRWLCSERICWSLQNTALYIIWMKLEAKNQCPKTEHRQKCYMVVLAAFSLGFTRFGWFSVCCFRTLVFCIQFHPNKVYCCFLQTPIYPLGAQSSMYADFFRIFCSNSTFCHHIDFFTNYG